jgi:hypothetical protein
MKSYRITIEINMSGDAGPESKDWQKAAMIRCESPYRLEVDISEWIKQEIDSTAIVGIVGCENCLDPARGYHAIDCRLHPEYGRK